MVLRTPRYPLTDTLFPDSARGARTGAPLCRRASADGRERRRASLVDRPSRPDAGGGGRTGAPIWTGRIDRATAAARTRACGPGRTPRGSPTFARVRVAAKHGFKE